MNSGVTKEPGPDRGYSLSSIEICMICLCHGVPGMAAAALWLGLSRWSLGAWFGGILNTPVSIALLGLLLLGCCCFAGWISTARMVESRRTGRWVESSLLMFIAHLVLTPLIALVLLVLIGDTF